MGRAPSTPLPFRIAREAGTARVISVDGAFGAPGLNLSHWPGNRTPRELAHALSTGAALAFARLPEARRAELAAGCEAVVNNHYDTDGVCAAFALLRPEEALPRAEALLAAAEAGDFFRVPSEAAFVVDAIVTGFADPERSPIAAELAGLDDPGRYERATRALLERLPAILDGDVAEYEALWRAPLEALRADQADLAECARDDVAHLELTIFTAPVGMRSRREGAPAAFDPGRHALFGATRADRVLVVGPGAAGTSYRVIVNTSSWFDQPEVAPLARPDLEALAARLQALESQGGPSEHSWRAQPRTNAAPELWYGAPLEAVFAEHSPALRPSRLPAEAVRVELFEALRAVWEFPE